MCNVYSSKPYIHKINLSIDHIMLIKVPTYIAFVFFFFYLTANFTNYLLRTKCFFFLKAKDLLVYIAHIM